MKKPIFYLAICLFVLLVSAGCVDVMHDAQPDGDSLYVSPDDIPLGNENQFADGPVYRGVVTDITAADGGTIIFKLESPPGAYYGYSSRLVQSGADTAVDFPLEDIVVGDHLEVSFIERNDGLLPLITYAVKLPAVEDSVYNGVVLSYSDNLLELEGLDGGKIIFSISEGTRLNIGEDEIVPGARLNIYHGGSLANSQPPMGMAIEVSEYHE